MSLDTKQQEDGISVFNPIRYKEMTAEELKAEQWSFVCGKQAHMAPVRREDVIGAQPILRQLDEIVNHLKRYDELRKLGVILRGGVLLRGGPGTGKTYISRWFATEADAHIVDARHFPRTDLKGKYRVHDVIALFGNCARYVKEMRQPVVIFFGEFDAFFGKESGDPDAVAQLKETMDGLGGVIEGVYVLASTNVGPDKFDSALLRRGRLGLDLFLPKPTRNVRGELLKFEVSKYRHEDTIDYDLLRYMLNLGLTPADINDIVNDIWRSVCLNHSQTAKKTVQGEKNEPKLTQEHLAAGLLRHIRTNPGSYELSDGALRRIALYEIGQAVVSRALGLPTQLIALTRYGYQDAFTIQEHDFRHEIPLSIFRRQIAADFGGILMHERCNVAPNTRGREHFAEATRRAWLLIEAYRQYEDEDSKKLTAFRGLSFQAIALARNTVKIPPWVGMDHAKDTERVAKMEKLIERSRNVAEHILGQFTIEELEEFARTLIKQEYLLEPEIDEFIAGREFDIPDDAREIPGYDILPGQYL